jgi:hypothetical protein
MGREIGRNDAGARLSDGRPDRDFSETEQGWLKFNFKGQPRRFQDTIQERVMRTVTLSRLVRLNDGNAPGFPYANCGLVDWQGNRLAGCGAIPPHPRTHPNYTYGSEKQHVSLCDDCAREVMIRDLDSFTESYIEAALWSSTDEADDSGGRPMDDNYSIEDIDPAMADDCRDFQESFGDLIDSGCTRQHPADSSNRQLAGFHFWLTRNRHGAGFWDGDWTEPYRRPESDEDEKFHPATGDNRYSTVGDYLTAMSRPYGEFNLYVGDDGRIYGS